MLYNFNTKYPSLQEELFRLAKKIYILQQKVQNNNGFNEETEMKWAYLTKDLISNLLLAEYVTYANLAQQAKEPITIQFCDDNKDVYTIHITPVINMVNKHNITSDFYIGVMKNVETGGNFLAYRSDLEL